MAIQSSVLLHLGLVLGALCALAGVAFQGLEAGFLWLLVGYFLGKSAQSTVWALTGSATS